INKPPVANAGTNQTITLPANSFSLNGSNSTDPDNNITIYSWATLSGPAVVTLTSANAATTTANSLVQGVYQFELTVKDVYGLSAKDTVVITVEANALSARWTSLEILPENDFLFAGRRINFLVAITDKVYAASKNGTFWYYNPQEKAWLNKGNLPTVMASTNFSVVFSIDNKAFFIGNGTSRQFNAASNEWVTKNNAPIGANHVDYSIPLVIGSKAYLVGSTNNVVTVYDPATDTYTQKNTFPDAGAAAGFVINNEAYCIQQDGRTWKYDLLTDKWQPKASMPTKVYDMSSFSVGEAGYVLGNPVSTPRNANSRIKVWRYIPSTDQWKQLDEDYPGQGLYAIKTVSVNKKAYVGLGYNYRDVDARDFWSFE
ncbi:MAG TPA: PKD domain-containing protein, partial [Segetibacter sp.]